MFAVSPSFAQDATAASKAGEDIIVTGSRIPRVNVERDQPTTVVTGKALDQRGLTSAAQALNQLPGFGIADSSLVGGQGNGFGVGQSFVNLYSLGSQRTLTLVDGRRFVGANPASVFSSAGAGTQVDLNVIPTQLIDRIETIGIGGAPIYGADAIAGTVNFILKKNFSGLDLDAQSGISEQGDLGNYRFRGLGGVNVAGGRGNLTVAAEYASQNGIIGTARDAIAAQTGFIQPITNSPYSSVLASNLRTFLGVPGGNPYFIDRGTIGKSRSIVDANGNFVRFGPNGDLIPFNTGTVTNDPTTFLGGDALNQATTTNLAVDSQRFNTSAFLNYQLTDHVKAFAEAWYSKNKATNLAGQPVYNTAFFSQSAPGSFDINGNFIFKLNNPFLTSQARALIQQNLIANGLPAGPNDVFYVGRANTDLVSGVAKLDQDLYRFVGGFRGDFKALGKDWKWEVSANYGRTRSVSITPTLVEPNLRRALNATTDAKGNIICAPFNPDPNDPTSPPNTPAYTGTISSTCAPLNLFGQGAPSQAARDYVTTNARTVAITSQRDLQANITGSLFNLPGGPLGVSFGYENRREYSGFDPDAFYTQALGRSIPINSVHGHYITNGISAEARAPIIGPQQHIPLVRTFEVNGAVREVFNSLAGNATTWTAGARYEPINGLGVRGNFTRSIRAPAVTELFAANQPAYDGGFDPCDAQNLGSGPNPAQRAKNCAAAGLPTDFVSLINSVTVPINVVGNRNLTNETANSWTVGAVVQPKFLRRFSLSADYISIELHNTVVASSAANVLSGCYDSSNYPNNFYCSLITRDTTPANFGQVLSLNEPYINQGGLVYRAVQAQADYIIPLGAGDRITLGATYQHIVKAYTTIDAFSPSTNTRGAIGKSVDQANVTATLDHGPISWFNQVRIIGPALFDPTAGPLSRDVPGVPTYVAWNTSLSFKVNSRATFQLNVDNVMNVNLPYPGSGNGSQNVYTEGLFGRTFLARFNIKY
jgi:outer membrane receptor protein involved in Fe transport